MAAILRDPAAAVVRTCPRAIPLAMITMRKSVLSRHYMRTFSLVRIFRQLKLLLECPKDAILNSLRARLLTDLFEPLLRKVHTHIT